MADSNNPRSHRGYDPQQRAAAADDGQPSAGSDPLAELARLIGQNDPFADFERNRARGEAPARAAAAPAAPPASVPHPQTYAAAPVQPQPQAYPEQYPAGAHQAGYSGPSYGSPADAYDEGYDPYADPDGHALDEADYQEQRERRRRRRRLATVLAILMLALVGGAGAYGYRTYVGSAVRAAPPPVIKADIGPTKVIPAAQAGDSASNKLIYDRVGDGKQAEKVVPREEKPVDIKTATVAQAPRVVHPAPDTNVVAAPPPSTISVTGQKASGQVLPVAAEPSIATHGNGAILAAAKKVRTVTIRPDMSVVPSADSAAAGNPDPAPRTTPPPVRSAEATRSVRTEAPPANAAPVRAASPPPPPPPRQTATAPLSLSAGNVSPPPPAPRAAPVRAAPAAAATQPLAATPSPASNEPGAAAGGSYLVQVSSQRSESDATASFRALQTRYPNVLGGRSSLVRRADLGGKGIYYRAMVGPFATGEQAAQFCTSLKAAGGQCIIHRN